jgi:DNA-binding NarL/FixJ family response regulator
MRLLLIDDAGSVRLRMEEALHEIEGLVVSARASSEGGILQHIIEEKTDIVVVDMQMRGGALDLVRSIKSAARPPIVMALSTISTLQYRAACHRAGAEFFFDAIHEQSRFCQAVADVQKELAG